MAILSSFPQATSIEFAYGMSLTTFSYYNY